MPLAAFFRRPTSSSLADLVAAGVAGQQHTLLADLSEQYQARRLGTDVSVNDASEAFVFFSLLSLRNLSWSFVGQPARFSLGRRHKLEPLADIDAFCPRDELAVELGLIRSCGFLHHRAA